jgi:hypothetical protein
MADSDTPKVADTDSGYLFDRLARGFDCMPNRFIPGISSWR